VLMAATPMLAHADSGPGTASPARVKALMSQVLAGAPAKEVQMMTVEYGPAGASLPHRHNAQVFVYVLEGSIRMQINSAPPVTLHPGDTFYEGPGDIHTLSENASATKPARFLVFMIKDTTAPVSVPVAAGTTR